MLGYLNAGFGRTLGNDWLNKIHNLGFTGIRTGSTVGWQAVVDELGQYEKLSPLFLFGGGNMEGWSAEDFKSYVVLIAKHIVENNYFSDVPVYFEIGNEPNLAVDAWKYNSEALNAVFCECSYAVKRIHSGIEMITGGISNTNERGLDYLDRFLRHPIPAESIVGFHRYSNGPDILTPHDNFFSREVEWQSFLGLTGNHRVFCTEVGHSTGPHQVKRDFPFCWRTKDVYLTEEVQAEAFEHEWNYYEREGVEGFVWYQHRDGPNRTDREDNFGMYYLDENRKVICDVAERVLR